MSIMAVGKCGYWMHRKMLSRRVKSNENAKLPTAISSEPDEIGIWSSLEVFVVFIGKTKEFDEGFRYSKILQSLGNCLYCIDKIVYGLLND